METKINFDKVSNLFNLVNKELKGKYKGVKAGYYDNATYPNGLKIAENAIIQNNGAIINIPPRTITNYRLLNEKTGKFKNKGRFVRKSKANFSKTYNAKGYSVIIPPRNFIERANNRQNEFKKTFLKQISNENINVVKALQITGLKMQNTIQEEIDKTLTPPNSLNTIRRKKSSHPLINTGRMRGAVHNSLIKDK